MEKKQRELRDMPAKDMGYKKGDFIWTGSFPGILISDLHTMMPMCEVWGFEQEMGSVYAKDLKRMSKEKFLLAARNHGHSLPLEPYAKEAKAALADS